MITYLLLRNNKESGPHSLDELVRIGLKPYDLVWVNGKSAAWRYPGEIEELKQHAPMVEEQPYDRFFKKPSDQSKQESLTDKPVVRDEDPVVAQQPVFTPKKSVYVTLPGHRAYMPRTEKTEPGLNKQEIVTEEPVISITENPVAAEIKYSQPLDEIKEMYVKTLQERKQRIAGRASLIRNMKKVAAAVVVVAAAALVAYSLQQNLPGRPDPVAENTMAVTRPVSTEPAPETILPGSTEQTTETVAEMPIEQPVEIIPPEKKKEPVAEEKSRIEKEVPLNTGSTEIVKETRPPVKKEIPVDQPSPGVDVNTRTGERSRKVRTGDEPAVEPAGETTTPAATNTPKAIMKSNDLAKLVTVKSNDYQVVAFGGIRNLQLTVYNESKYILDNVTVELQYLKPSEQPLRTENIEFRSVAPGGTMTIRVPDTNRGIKIVYRISNILSTQSAKEMAGL